MTTPLFFEGEPPSPRILPVKSPSSERSAAETHRKETIKSVNDSLKADEETLKKKSILNKLNPSQESLIHKLSHGREAVQALVLTNLSYSAKETGYEGWNLKSAANLYTAHFDNIQQGGVFADRSLLPEAARESVRQLQEVPFENAGETAQRIADLSENQSLTLQGGWWDIPFGHAMIYRFEKGKGDTFNIYLYHASGTDRIHGGETRLGRKKSHPCMVFRGVTWGELFFCNKGEPLNPVLFQNLIDLNRGVGVLKGSLQAVLDCFFHLQHRLVPSNELARSNLFISMQVSGNCPVKSLNCLLLDLINNTTTYKKIALDVRLFTLIALYHCFQRSWASLQDKEIRLFQLKEASANFLNVLNANFLRKQMGITEAQYTTACATIKEMQEELTKLEAEVESSRCHHYQVGGVYAQAEDEPILQQRAASMQGLPTKLAPSDKKRAIFSLPLEPKLGQNCLWKDLEAVFDRLSFLIQSLNQAKRQQDLIFQVEATLRNLAHLKKSSPDPSLEGTKAFECQTKLLELQESYNAAIYHLGDRTSPASQNTGMEFLALSYCLALAVDRGKKVSALEKFGLGSEYFFDAARKDRLFACQDQELLKQRRELELFFKEKKQTIWGITKESVSENSFLQGSTPEGALYAAYIAQSEPIRQELAELAKERNSSKPEALYGALNCYKSSEDAGKVPSLLHLHRLRGAAILTSELCLEGEKSRSAYYKFKGYWSNAWSSTFNFYTIRNQFDAKSYHETWDYKAFKRDFSPQGELEKYEKHDQSAHGIAELQKENTVILRYKQDDAPVEFPFYVGLAEPEVQTTVLLQEAEVLLDRLADSKFRALLLHMFVKNVEKGDGLISPFILGLKDPLSIRKFERLVMLGKKSFVDMMPETKPQLEEMLFIIRLYCRALQTLRSLHPKMVYTQETLHLIAALKAFLMKAETLAGHFPEPEELKKEIRLARVGLFLGLPLEKISPEEQALFLIEVLRFKNDFPASASCSDPSFVRECKRQFFHLEESWQAVLRNPQAAQTFANACLNQLLGRTDIHLRWELKGNRLIALEEKWEIDLSEPSIRNAQGSITEVHKELNSTASFKRLFQDHRYALKIFGAGTKDEEIYFTSPIWGPIKIIGEKMIQRKIGDEWFTYIPHERAFAQDLRLNHALFGDHALWVNLNNPADVLFCDLATGQQVYHAGPDGRIYHDKSGKVFYPIRPSSFPTQLSRFEDVEQINGWINPTLAKEKEGRDLLELSRFRTAEGNHPVTFKWDSKKEVWEYSPNPIFHIDNGADIPLRFHVDHFLHLVNEDKTKRRILIPLAPVESSGYSPDASIKLPKLTDVKANLDGQKGSIRLFEYVIGKGGELAAETLEGTLYLAHLYLAQKRYADAAVLLKRISHSENLSQNALKQLEALLHSSKATHDFSPNAAAIHLLAYYVSKRINPFFNLDKECVGGLAQEYKFYCDRLNNVEETLQFSPEIELELMAFFGDQKDKHDSLFFKEREAFLKQALLPPRKVFSTTPKKGNEKIDVRCSLNFLVPPKESPKKEKDYIQSISSCLESLAFTKCYRALKEAGSAQSPKAQGILYEILLDEKKGYSLSKFSYMLRNMLYLVAQYPKEAPELPEVSASDEAKKNWYQALDRLPHHSGGLWGTPEVALALPEVAQAETAERLTAAAAQPTVPNIDPPLVLIEEGQDASFKKWQEAFLIARGETSSPKRDSAEGDSKGVNKDPLYAHAIAQHREFYHKDCAKAAEQQKNKQVFKPGLLESDYRGLITEMKRECDRARQSEEQLSEQVQKWVNRLPTDTFLHFTQEMATLIGQKRKRPTLETILRAASQPKGVDALIKLNPHLSTKEAAELRCMCIELMIENTHRRQLERVYAPLEKWLDGGSKNKTYFEQARLALAEHRHYDPTQQFFPLFFEYLADLRVSAKQAVKINDLLSRIFGSGDKKLMGRAFQLIMGGGKTSVIISMLCELIAEAGLVPCILVHHSQFTSVKGVLKAHQAKRFGKDIYVIDYSLQNLSEIPILKHILQRMQEAKRKKCSLVMKTTFPQILELKFILEGLRLPSITTAEETAAQNERIELLRQINLFLNQECVSIYDECDLSLSMLTDVHIPQGAPENIKPERASLIKAIYENLLDPQIQEKIGLAQNAQTELASEDLDKHVIPLLAKRLFENSSLRLQAQEQYRDAFCRYVTDQIPKDDQVLADRIGKGETVPLTDLSPEQRENIDFLCELEKRYRSDDRYQNESCQLIALARKVICRVLKVALSRSFNRRYGHDLEHDDGRVIPYLAVSTPATTKFGNIFLALAFQFQRALNTPITKGEITFLAKQMYAAAVFYSKKDKVPFLSTAEAKQFEELTSVSLIDVQTEKGLQKAYEWVNDPKHLKRRLDLEAEVAPFHVRYYRKKVTSNPINNAEQFKRAKIACSATLWNHPTFHRDLQDPHFDEGAEGTILNVMAERAEEYAAKGLDFIHEIPNNSLESFFHLMKNHPQKKRLRGIFDGGGLLTDYPKEYCAQELRKFFLEQKDHGGPEIKAILYLHTFSPEEVAKGYPKESFAILRLDSEEENPQPVLLKNTTGEEIERVGLKKEELFAFFDELRANGGTDSDLADDGIFLMPCDHRMPMRSGVQCPPRARKIFLEQVVEPVVTTKGRKEMVNGGKTFYDLKETWEINEAVTLKNEKDRARPAQIENIGRSALVAELLEKGPYHADFKRLITRYEKFFVSDMDEEDIYLQEKIQGSDSTINVLETYADAMLKRYRVVAPHVEQDVLRLVREFKQEIPPEEKMPVPLHENAELEILQELEQNLQLDLTEQEQEIEIHHELSHEWESYNFTDSPQPYREREWSGLDSTKPLLAQIQAHLESVSKTLERTEFGVHKVSPKTKEYAKGFPNSLHMTRNFYMTSIEELPLLHVHSKAAKFMLCIEESGQSPQFILLSECDTAFFKVWINQYRPKGVFLIDIKGFPEANSESFDQQPRSFHEAILKGLCYANLFNGDMVFLEDHAKVSKSLFAGHHNALAGFIAVKLLSTKGAEALHKLGGAKVFDFSKAKLPKPPQHGILFSSRKKLIEKKYREIRGLGPEGVRDLDPEDVPDIAPHQVPWLVSFDQLCMLDEDQLKDTVESQRVTLRRGIEALHRSTGVNSVEDKHLQFLDLTADDIEQLQLSRLLQVPGAKWRLISNPKLAAFQKEFDLELAHVQLLDGRQLKVLNPSFAGLLSDGQIGLLTEEHQPLIDAVRREKLSLLKDSPLQKIKTTRLAELDQPTFQRITNVDLLLATPGTHLHWLTPTQLNLLDAALENPENVRKLTRHLFLKLVPTKPELIKKLGETQVRWLNAESMLFQLEDGQLGWISDAQIINLVRSKAMVQRLQPVHIEHIHPDAVPEIRDGRHFEKLKSTYAEFLEDGQIPLLTEKHQHLIDALHKEKLPLLNDSALQKIKENRLEELDPPTFQRIINIDLLLATPGARLHWLTPRHLDLLNAALEHPENVRKLTGHLFLKLVPTKSELIKKLGETQVKWLNDEWMLLLLEDSQIEWLSNDQITFYVRSEQMAKRLKPRQIVALNPETRALLGDPLPDPIPLQQAAVVPEIPVALPPPTPIPQQAAVVEESPIPSDTLPPQPIEEESKCTQITRIALCILAGLIGISALLCGCLALAHVELTFAPQFIVTAFDAIKNSAVASYVLTVGGGVILLGLVGYVIYSCRQNAERQSQ